jgi:hypothetical protein
MKLELHKNGVIFKIDININDPRLTKEEIDTTCEEFAEIFGCDFWGLVEDEE